MKRLSIVVCCALTVLTLAAGPIARAMDPKPDPKAKPVRELPPAVDSQAACAAIRAALQRPVPMEFSETPLHEVLNYLRDMLRIPIVVDHRGFDDVGVAPDSPITFALQGVSTRSALNLLLSPLNLDYVVTNEVLLITTSEKVDECRTARVYEVADLVLVRNAKDQVESDFDRLIDVITTTVEPHNWDTVGGPGSIAPYKIGAPLLVVCQTDRVHEKIEDLLTAMRKAAAKKMPDHIPTPIPDVPRDHCCVGPSGMGMGPQSTTTKPK